MTRRFMMAATLAVLVGGAASAAAHENYRIIGTITKVTTDTLDVKQTKDGKIVSMDMDEKTVVTRDRKKLSAAELKTGLSVVVDARGDSLEELLVLAVRLVPPPAGK